jgi:large subunit ribosomal protein L24
MKLKIRKGDTVEVIAGADKGKKGKVIEVKPSTMKIKVEGVKIMTHFDKKDGQKKLEGFFDYSNVAMVEKAKAAGETKKKAAKKKTSAKNA